MRLYRTSKKLSYIVRRLTAFLLVAFFYCLSSGVCSAYTITIVENKKSDFGTVQQPGSGSQSMTLDPGTGSETGTGTLLYGTTTNADYTIRCTAGCSTSSTATVQITNGSTGSSSLTVPTITGKWDNGTAFALPKSGLSLGSNVSHDLKLGATVTYTNGVPIGTITPTYTLTVSTP